MVEAAFRRANRRSGGLIALIILLLLILLYWSSEGSFGWSLGPRIAVVPLKGVITSSHAWIEKFTKLARRKQVAAVVIPMDTPGGGVAASQEIYTALKTFRSQTGKPVVISMEGVAASGGYYVSLGADRIVADPGTITGSIGVVMTFPDVSGLLGKLGIKMNVLHAGRYKDAGSPFRTMTSAEKEYFQNVMDDVYRQFVSTVARERHLSWQQADSLAQGKIYSGRQAWEAGLVDTLGGFQTAVDLACKLAGIEPGAGLVYPPKPHPSLWDWLFGGRSAAETAWSTGMRPAYLMPW